MVVMIGCHCARGLGIVHEHIGIRHVFERFSSSLPGDSSVFRLDAKTVELNGGVNAIVDTRDNLRYLGEEPEAIRVWIDWKAVAKALMEEPHVRGTCPNVGCIAFGQPLSEVWGDGKMIYELCPCCDHRTSYHQS